MNDYLKTINICSHSKINSILNLVRKNNNRQSLTRFERNSAIDTEYNLRMSLNLRLLRLTPGVFSPRSRTPVINHHRDNPDEDNALRSASTLAAVLQAL